MIRLVLLGLIYLPFFICQPFALANRTRPGKDFALFFAVNHYEHHQGAGGWSNLSGPIRDAEEIARDLRELYGFETEIVQNPTLDQINQKLDAYRKTVFAPDAQLLIFFSGHGYFIDVLGEGFFIPQNGKPAKEDPSQLSWISLIRLRRHVSTLPCRHILLAIDACYSGTIDEKIIFKGSDSIENFSRPGENSAAKSQRIVDLLRAQSRIYLTSGAKQRTPDPSSFAAQFKKALRGLGGNDGILSTRELEEEFLSEAKPLPLAGTFEGHEDGGKFLFVYADRIPPPLVCKSLTTVSLNSNCEYIVRPDEILLNKQKVLNDLWIEIDRTPPLGTGPWSPPALTALDLNKTYQVRVSDIKSENKCWGNIKVTGPANCQDDDDDGIPNFQDKCPDEKGPLDSRGCPEMKIPEFMVRIPGGTFEMGDLFGDGKSEERPVHSVKLNDFYMGKTEVTVEEFRAFIEATGYKTDAEKNGGSQIWDGKKWNKNNSVNWRYDEEGILRTADNYPVIHVSWNDAIFYCNWLSEQHGLTKVYTIHNNEVIANWLANGYRLPTEAEWEYAARSAGKQYKFAWGDGHPNGNIADETGKKKMPNWLIWPGYADNYVYAAPVGHFIQGDFGLSDMTGNLCEWCWDWFGANYYSNSERQNPKGPESGSNRVLRGGSWLDRPMNVRTTCRKIDSPSASYSDYGFRIARNAIRK